MSNLTITIPPGDTSVTIIVQAESSPDILARLTALETSMSQADDLIAADKASADAALARVTTDLANLTAQVQTLTAAAAAGTLTPAQAQALTDLKAEIDSVDPATITPAPTPPATPPTS